MALSAIVMTNSLILGQEFVSAAILPVHQAHPFAYFVHYMDDIILADKSSSTMHRIVLKLNDVLHIIQAS